MNMLLKKRVNPAKRISAGFALLILAGTVLLMLPVSSKIGEFTPFMTALFTATSASCVTGLVLVETGAYFSYFGQAVILMLIQIGGLGFMMILSIVFFAVNKRMGLRDRMMIAQSLGTDSVSGVVRIAKHTLIATGIVEGTGAVLLAFRFIPQFGVKGIWYSVFHSVSAFCNAGFDVLGRGDSIMMYKNDPLVLITVGLLIIIGGLGFIVWEDIRTQHLTAYSKIVLILTVILLAAGTAGFYTFEYSNPETLGDDSTRLLGAFFQSVTVRTAGFDAIGQGQLTEQSKLFSVILMMLGGASGSTAGGIKVATAAVIIAAFKSVMSGKKDAVIMKRTIPESTVMHAMTIVGLWFILVTFSGLIISAVDGLPILDCIYETASAYDTVGLTCGVMAKTGMISKLIMIVLMYFGRVGIMTISVMFISSQSKNDLIKYPEANLLIG